MPKKTAKKPLVALAATTPRVPVRTGRPAAFVLIPGLYEDLRETIAAEMLKPPRSRHSIQALYDFTVAAYPDLGVTYNWFWRYVNRVFGYRGSFAQVE